MNTITQFDFSVLNFIQEHFRCDFLDVIMPFITSLGDVGFIWILTSVILLFFKKTRKLGIQLLISIFFAFVIYQCILKPIIARPRPFVQNPVVELLIKSPKDFSFPSGHTACGFSFVIILFLAKNKWWIPSLILATLIGFSRLYLYVHFPTDVLCGALCGIIFGAISYYFSSKLLKKCKM
ncbi:MAG: phosphatase PAP2 family protein [Spirochaetaceae bacterium]|nr:phosphatase PAP2 family protein [Spirochaetaceae bacterium]